VAITVANIEMFDFVLEKIEADPGSFAQNFWATRTECGTAFCIAGHAATLDGSKPLWDTGWTPRDNVAISVLTPEGFEKLIGDHGREVLGLTELQAQFVFHPGNTLSQLCRMRDALEADPLDALTELARIRQG
jgi:hypothetical protein